MQNIPAIAEDVVEQFKAAKSNSRISEGNSGDMFAALFERHSELVDEELSLAPLSHTERMAEKAPASASASAAATREDEEDSTVLRPAHEAVEQEDRELPGRDRKMTEEEFDELKDDLKEYGLSDEEIKELENRVSGEKGMTWGEFVQTLAQKMADMRKVSLTDDQVRELDSFFSRFGFNKQESAKLINQLQNGETGKVMAAMQAKLDAMPQDQPLFLAKGEVEAFVASLNASKELAARMKELLGQQTLPKDIKEAFTALRKDMARADRKDMKLIRSVGRELAKAVDETTQGSSAARDLGEAVDLRPRTEGSEAKADAHRDFNQAADKREQQAPGMMARRSAEVDPNPAAGKQDSEADEQKQAWKEFFDRLRTDDTTKQSAQSRSRESLDQMLKGELAEARAQTDAKLQTREKITAPKLARQVESAFLKNLSNGTKQLNLQLTPENLGKLSIVLSVQNKEVNAVIRTENHEAAKLINDQLDSIRNTLESQGLKVDKLEVQAGLANNQDNSQWQGEMQHNLARERESLAFMRNHLRTMRGEQGDVAQDMQSIREQAIHAAHGLHVVA